MAELRVPAPPRRHLLSIRDLGRDDVERLLETSRGLASSLDREVKKLPTLRGRTVVNVFYESSTRTSSSFELAAKRLSADVMSIKASGSAVDKGESLKDTALTLDAYGALPGQVVEPDMVQLDQVRGDGYGYDIAVNPAKNALLTSSFTGSNNYMRELGEVVKDPEAMKHFGNTMVMWNLKTMQPEQILTVPGAPLEIRWALPEGQNWAITAAALTSQLWLVKRDARGVWAAKDVAAIGDPAKIPLPVDISITADAKTYDGTTDATARPTLTIDFWLRRIAR